MSMTITNLTNQDYWFGPLHLPAGTGSQLIVDDTSATSLYLTDDAVADAINTLYAAAPARITVTGAAAPFPRPTGTPEVLHGNGSPDGIVYAGQGSIFLRRDNAGGTQLYQKTTGIHVNTGWLSISGALLVPTGSVMSYAGQSAPTGYLMCDGSAVSRSTFSDLFNALGGGSSPWGLGDGSTTFNLPDLRGRVAVGMGTNPSVNALNQNDTQPVANRRPHHRTSNALSITDPGHTHNLGDDRGAESLYIGNSGSNSGSTTIDDSQAKSTNGIAYALSHTTNISLGGSIGTNNANDALDTPSFVVINYIIKT